MDYHSLAAPTRVSKSKVWRFLGRALLVATAILFALALDMSPTVPPGKTPTAEQAKRARDVAHMAGRSLRYGNGLATLHADGNDLASAAALATSLGKYGRFDSGIKNGTLTLRASRRFAFIWLNGEARITSSARGFPETRLKIGDLSLGPSISRWVIDLARRVIRWRGVNAPPLDNLVRQVRVESNDVSALIYLPLNGAFANDLSRLHSQPIDAATTASVFCRLTTLNRKQPTDDMALIVRRAFGLNPSNLSINEQNRATFIALAMYVTLPEAGRLAGDAEHRVKSCHLPNAKPLLAGRADLAAHWALSAALAVSLGDEIGGAMGEWKELSDSRPGGSGFSFVDLAADRSGLAVARRASDPAAAAVVAARLRKATDEDLLPIRALALSEGLSEQDFVKTYQTLESVEFAAAKGRIDRVISKTIGR
jgi:uncharacterized protein YfiM (DUF2279 family)